MLSVFSVAGIVPGTGDMNVSTKVFAFMAFIPSLQEDKQWEFWLLPLNCLRHYFCLNLWQFQYTQRWSFWHCSLSFLLQRSCPRPCHEFNTLNNTSCLSSYSPLSYSDSINLQCQELKSINLVFCIFSLPVNVLSCGYISQARLWCAAVTNNPNVSRLYLRLTF